MDKNINKLINKLTKESPYFKWLKLCFIPSVHINNLYDKNKDYKFRKKKGF